MKASRSMGGLAGAMALSCLLGFSPQRAEASVVLNGCAGGSFGDACSLAELVGGGSMDINDVRFSSFGLDSFGRALNTAAIRIDPIDTLYKPGFTLVDTGGTLTLGGDVNDPANNGTFNILAFALSLIGGNHQIFANDLAMVVGDLTGGNSVAHVSESVFDQTQTDVLGLKDAFCSSEISPSCANSTVIDSALFSPVDGLAVQTLIDVTGDAAGVAQITSITTQFSQIPEPGSLALLTLGLVGMRTSSRRRRQLAAD